MQRRGLPAQYPFHSVVSLLLAAMFTVLATSAVADESKPLTGQIDAVFAKFDKPDSPGCAVAVVKDGQVIHNRGYGIANLDYGLPIKSDSVFYMASVSKQFTAACIALLAQDGKLSLDDPIQKHIPEIPEYEGGPITVRHLVHHTSGLRDYLMLMVLARRNHGDVHTSGDILKLIARQKKTNFRPGEKYLYSNSGYFLMAEIVERVSGRSIREYADEKIFQPLGMHDTHFHDDHTQVVKNRVISYMPRGDGYQVSYLANFDQVGSGGLLSTLDDMLKWDRNFEKNRVGSDGFLKLMTTLGKLNDGSELDYAFGLSLGEYKGLSTVGHGGSMMGFRTQLLRFPEERVSVIVLSNLGTTNPGTLARQVADLVLADEVRAALEPYTGHYHSDELDVTYQIDLAGPKLVLRRADEADAELVAGNEAELFRLADSPGLQVRFSKDQAGRVTGCALGAGRAQNLEFAKTESTE